MKKYIEWVNRNIRKKYFARAFFIILGVLLINSTYYACQNAHFEIDPEKIKEDIHLESLKLGGISIENGAEFVNKKNVILTLSYDNATEMYITHDPSCETGGEWEPYNPIKQWTLNLSNAEATVYVKYKNVEGYSSGCALDSIIEDEIPPEISISKIPKYSNAKEFPLNFIATDSLSGIDKNKCLLSGKAEFATVEVSNCSPGHIFSIEKDGPYESIISSLDKAGNRSEIAVNWISDFKPPVVKWISFPAVSTGPQPSSSLHRFQSTDENGVERTECFFGKSIEPIVYKTCVKSDEFLPDSMLEGGNYTFSVRAIDVAGNVSVPLTNHWSVGESLPDLWFTNLDLPKHFSNSQQAHFSYEAKYIGEIVPAEKFECNLDNGGFSKCPNGKDFVQDSLKNGTHKFQVRIIYGSDNKISSPISYEWLVDLDLPEVRSLSGPTSPTKDNLQASLTWTNVDFPSNENSGIAKSYCKLDSTDVACSSLQSYNYNGGKLSDGTHQFSVVVEDNAGNKSSTSVYNWVVDATPPTIKLTQNPDPLTAAKNAIFGFQGTDALSGISFFTWKLDAGAAQNCVPSTNTPNECSITLAGPLTEGTHLLRAFSTDKAGNPSPEITYEWKIDFSPPIIQVLERPAYSKELLSGGSNVIKFSVTDASPITDVQCGLIGHLANCALTQSEYQVDFGALPAGQYKFQIQTKDSLGNSAPPLDIVWTITNSFLLTEQDTTVYDSNVDILFVIDNSGSMSNEQTNLGARVGNFIDKLNGFSGLDWKIAVTTTDMVNEINYSYYNYDSSKYSQSGTYKNTGTKGQLFLPRKGEGMFNYSYLSDNFILPTLLTAAQGYLSGTVQIGTNGSGDEQGIKATNRVLQRALDYKTNNCTEASTSSVCIQNRPNSKFVRDNSHLSVLVISDEKEALAEDQNLPTTLVSLVRNKFNNRPFLFNSIAWIDNPSNYGLAPTMKSNCSTGAESEGKEYLALSQMTGGVIGNICDSDYAPIMEKMGQKVNDLVHSITLSCANGTPVLDFDKDGVDDFTVNGHPPSDFGSYHQDGNRVVFDTKLASGSYHVKYYCPN